MTITPGELRDQFAALFADLLENPREVKVPVYAPGFTLDLVEGEIVFRLEGHRAAKGTFGRRWLAEHPVPLRLGRKTVFKFIPTTGERVKVRV